MKPHVRTRKVADFSPLGDLASLGAPCVGVDLTLGYGYSFPTGPSHTAHFVSAVALLNSYAGCFGWRLTNRQAGALAQAGFACRSWK